MTGFIMQKLFLSLLIMVLCSRAWATSSVAPASNPSPTINSSTTAAPVIPGTSYKKDLCPPANTLTVDQDLWWSAPGDWKSDSQSFAKSIDHYIGAHWSGINVGKVVCLYVSGDKSSFPIALVRENLVPAPSEGLWGPLLNGEKDCRSYDIKDCPFLIEQEEKVGPDLYKELDFFRNKSQDSDNSGP
jgi:hypothetical protein